MAHEDLTRDHDVEGSSDRMFGVVFAALFAVIAAWPLLSGGTPRWWAVGIAAVFALVALLKPALLSGLNRRWIALGVLLGKVVSPVALGVLFYAVITPIGLLMRAAGKDPLRLKLDRTAASYWIERDPPGPSRDSIDRQF